MRPRVRKIGGFCHRIRAELLRQGWKWCKRCRLWYMPLDTDPHYRHCCKRS